MASNNIARLGVVLGLDTAEFTAEVDKAIAINKKMANEIKRDTNAAAGELANLKHATEDYGKALSKVELIQREITSGRFMNATSEMKQRLLEQAAAYDKIAVSQKKITGELTQQQKLALTYQTTDLFTQIASGQNPMIALIQQGGQLKDQMGGLGGMFRALGTLITPFSVGLTSVVAIFGSLGLALYKAKDELDKFKDSMTLTGQFAGIAYSQFVSMGDALSQKLGASIGSTRDVLSELVSSGQFTAKSIDSVASVILKFAKISGVDAKDAAKQLIPLMDGTASSAKQLNDKYHFLTLEQYKYIKQLEEQGRLQESAKFTADKLKDSLSDTERNLGTLETAWKTVKEMASGAWDAMLGIGRAPTAKSLKSIEDEINKTVLTIQQRKGLGLNTQTMEAELEKMRQKLADETGKIYAEIDVAEAKAKAAEENQRKINWEEKYGMAAKQKAVELAKQIAETDYIIAVNSATEINKMILEKDKKIADARLEMRQKNESEKNQFVAQNTAIFNEKQFQAEQEYSEKLKQFWLKKYMEQAEIRAQYKQDEIDYENARGKAMEQSNQAAQDATKNLTNQKQLLELKRQMIYATEEEQRLAEISLKYGLQRRENYGKENEAFLNMQADKQEAIENFNVAIEISTKKTQQVFDSVYGNLGAAIDNFVKTGKLSMKDLARSIIQDLIAIQMKAAAMRFLGGAFSMFSGFAGGANMQIAAGTVGDYNTLGMLSGQRASGGSVTNDAAYLVGERGPELFVPSGSGTIIPNNQMGNMGGTTNVTNNYINAIDTKSFEDRLLGSSNAIWAANQYANKSLAVNRGRA